MHGISVSREHPSISCWENYWPPSPPEIYKWPVLSIFFNQRDSKSLVLHCILKIVPHPLQILNIPIVLASYGAIERSSLSTHSIIYYILQFTDANRSFLHYNQILLNVPTLHLTSAIIWLSLSVYQSEIFLIWYSYIYIWSQQHQPTVT